MKGVIPVHHLPNTGRIPIGVDLIEASDVPVQNDVHRHDFYELFVFATGTGDHMIDLEHVPMEPPCVHLVAPGQVHRLGRSADSTGAVVMFGADALMTPGTTIDVTRLFQVNGRSRAFPLSTDQHREAMALVTAIAQESAPTEEALSGVVNGYLQILLIKCARWQRNAIGVLPAAMDINDAVTRFMEKVEREFLEKRSVSAYANDLNMSPDHLSDLVRKRLGKSAIDVIHERLLLEAKRLLLHASLTVKEVSHALQMEDPAYFNRMFKKAMGMTPLAYREHIREKYQH